ncbi:hypothetical protein GCM10008956_24970 [Deinococcus arenae]|uniref:DUF7079 domain-containing protein n=2 Tax=Deinococcus arenae TaxID=1452751 RepID=A0A8H9L9G3_9DEIO|nr:hypothetical protein GCM10008956_24970 [Deinococcus arenae]
MLDFPALDPPFRTITWTLMPIPYPSPDSRMPRRRAAWRALSALFLDTEVDPAGLAAQLRATGFSLPELRQILRAEVAPVLGGNLLSAAGFWDAFDLSGVEARCRAGRARPTLTGALALRVIRADWQAVEARFRAEQAPGS